MPRPADKIRSFSREKYVLPARNRRLQRFSIRMGDVVRELKLIGRAPAVCSALKSQAFLKQNGLQLVESTGPRSGQSTTVTYTYEFVDEPGPTQPAIDPWTELRGTLKQVFAEFGGGEAYLRNEREQFHESQERS